MGIQGLSELENGGFRPTLHLVRKGDAGSALLAHETVQEKVTLEKVTLDDATREDATEESGENLGCARGVIMAFGFQAAALVLGIALWKLHFFVH